MAKIETGRYSDTLRRLLGMKGQVEVSGELAPEISPVFTLESERPDWEFLKNQKLLSGIFQGTAIAAQTTHVRLRNDAATGVMAILGYFSIVSPAAITWFIERNVDAGVNLAVVHPTSSRDTRFPAFGPSALIVSTGNNAPLGGVSWEASSVAADVRQEVRLPFVLTPGHQVQLNTATVNVAIRGVFTWLERRIDALELE